MDEWVWRKVGMTLTREKSTHSRSNLSQRQFVHHKSHMDLSEVERGPLQSATNGLRHGTVHILIQLNLVNNLWHNFFALHLKY